MKMNVNKVYKAWFKATINGESVAPIYEKIYEPLGSSFPLNRAADRAYSDALKFLQKHYRESASAV